MFYQNVGGVPQRQEVSWLAVTVEWWNNDIQDDLLNNLEDILNGDFKKFQNDIKNNLSNFVVDIAAPEITELAFFSFSSFFG